MLTDQRLMGTVEQEGMIVSVELGLTWATLCTVGGIVPLGSRCSVTGDVLLQY
ncbi:TMV resistance protein N-like [Pyrus ussuriensis x Pyrus communis]|uniref:TMV resistance protein N-like n=1 Tax=Pyrus ussuriensis x Pyrus communis TaxID=2448454 RepID=A0A5N5FQN8_9ROSA|nr:TMV resistance protein N-like [Pyrus ussuriensis x Pyrus communis]